MTGFIAPPPERLKDDEWTLWSFLLYAQVWVGKRCGHIPTLALEIKEIGELVHVDPEALQMLIRDMFMTSVENAKRWEKMLEDLVHTTQLARGAAVRAGITLVPAPVQEVTKRKRRKK